MVTVADVVKAPRCERGHMGSIPISHPVPAWREARNSNDEARKVWNFPRLKFGVCFGFRASDFVLIMLGMIRLAFSTNAFKKNTLDEAIDAIARIGYAGIEVMADVPHALPGKLDKNQIAEIKRRIEGGGQACSNVNAFTLFACGDTYHPTWIEG